MNTFNNNILKQFRSQPNVKVIRDAILRHFDGDHLVREYVSGNLMDQINDQCNVIASELNVSSPVPGIGVRDQVWAFTNQFINDRISFISIYVLGVNGEDTPVYCIGDGDPTSRTTLRQQQRPADEILARWDTNCAQPLTMRDDLHAYRSSAYLHNHVGNDGDYTSGRLYKDPREYVERPYAGGVCVQNSREVNDVTGQARAQTGAEVGVSVRGPQAATKCANMSTRGTARARSCTARTSYAAAGDDGAPGMLGVGAAAHDVEHFADGARASPRAGTVDLGSADYRWPAAHLVANSDVYGQRHYDGNAGGANYARGGANGASGIAGTLNTTSTGYYAPGHVSAGGADSYGMPGGTEGYGSGNVQLHTGITFADQSSSGQDAHYNYLFNDTFHALNKGGPIAGNAFGNSTEFTNNRLLNRRIFRNGSDGVENGIPFYEKALYNRYYDRDIRENLRAAEFDYQVQRNDMGSLYKRADLRQQWKFNKDSPHAQYC